jgi:hypothetical protein
MTSPLARLRTASVATLLSISVGMLPLEGALAASPAPQIDPALARVNAALDTPCTSDSPMRVAAANVDDTSANPTSNLPATAANPAPSSSATASPNATVEPFAGPLRGAGVLVVPVATASPGITPPPVPTPSVAAVASAGPVFLTRGTSKPSVTATATPSESETPKPMATLGPNQIAVLADTVEGGARLDMPSDAIGNVHVYFRDGVIIGDRAHYDGKRYITLSGTPTSPPYIEDAAHDSRLYGDTIVFDMVTNRAVLKNGSGTTTRGVENGLIHYGARNLVATSSGAVHGDHATFSTCENPRGGYHVTARTLDVIPGQKLIAKGAVVFLGALAIFFIPVISIPLNRTTQERRPVVFAPEMGYDSADGFYVRARIGFGTTANYYGYYRVEEYTRRGFGLGYVAFIGSRNGRHKVNLNLYAFNNNAGGGEQNNFSVQDQETFSKHLQAQIQGTYTSEYGPYVDLPPSYSLNAAINHTTDRSTQSYSFSKTAVGSTQSTINAAFQDIYKISPSITQAFDLNYAENINSYAGVTTPTSSLHINSLTSATTHNADYTFTIDQTDSDSPSGYNSIPEFVFHPHTGHGTIPIDTKLTLGNYHEDETYTDANGHVIPGREAGRAELAMTAGPAVFKVLKTSTFSATAGANQYYYTTGDLKAQTSQTMNLTTPITSHISNTIQYQEQNLAGPQSLPFQYLDVLGGVSHNAQETMNISNGGIYTLTLTTGTGFNHQAQPISYQLISRPSSRSYFSVGGSYLPGSGMGFYTTNIQVSTPFGRDQSLEFTSNIDWKNGARLEDKNIYFRKIVGNCYDIRVSYNQDLKAVNLSLDLLAFPSHGANFGYVSQQQAIFPQNFALQ